MTRKRKRTYTTKYNANECAGTWRNDRRYKKSSRLWNNSRYATTTVEKTPPSSLSSNIGRRTAHFEERSGIKPRELQQDEKLSPPPPRKRRRRRPRRPPTYSREYPRQTSWRSKRRLFSEDDNVAKLPSAQNHPHSTDQREITIPGFKALLDGFDQGIKNSHARDLNDENKLEDNCYQRGYKQEIVHSKSEKLDRREERRVCLRCENNKSNTSVSNTKSQPFEHERKRIEKKQILDKIEVTIHNKSEDPDLSAVNEANVENCTKRKRLKLLSDEQIRELASQYMVWQLLPIDLQK